MGVFNGTEQGTFSGSVNDEGKVSGKFSNVPDMFNPMLVLEQVPTRGLKRCSG